jgi:hypothetical protein
LAIIGLVFKGLTPQSVQQFVGFSVTFARIAVQLIDIFLN